MDACRCWRLTASAENFYVAEDDPGRVGPFDLRGSTVRFAAKRRIQDREAVLQLDNAALGGITVLDDDPGNVAEISLRAEHTAALDAPARLAYDVTVDAAGHITVVETGSLTVRRAITDP
jgi:hypothetical protein